MFQFVTVLSLSCPAEAVLILVSLNSAAYQFKKSSLVSRGYQFIKKHHGALIPSQNFTGPAGTQFLFGFLNCKSVNVVNLYSISTAAPSRLLVWQSHIDLVSPQLTTCHCFWTQFLTERMEQVVAEKEGSS